MLPDLTVLSDAVAIFLDSRLEVMAKLSSVVTLVFGFMGGAWWRRHRQLIEEDRETTLSLAGLPEVYVHLKNAEDVLRRSLFDESPRKESASSAYKGLITSRQKLRTFFGAVYGSELIGSNLLIETARWLGDKGRFEGMEECLRKVWFEHSGKDYLGKDDLSICLRGLQVCAIVRGDRGEAVRWGLEAEGEELSCCVPSSEVGRWFMLRRLIVVLVSKCPDIPQLLRRKERNNGGYIRK